MKYIFIIISLALFACSQEMTRSDVISAVNECKEKGLYPNIVRDGMNYTIKRVECLPEHKETAGEKVCREKGMLPIYSSWNGKVKDCKKVE